MFDDQPTSQAPGAGAPPTNLPIGEPEDMFGDAEPSAAPSDTPAPHPVAPSAVDAGMLKPKIPAGTMSPAQPSASLAEAIVHTPPPDMRQAMDDIKEPKTAKRIMTIALILIGVAFLVGIVWFVFNWLTGSESAAPAPAPASPLPAEEAVNEGIEDSSIDSAVLFGEPIDADGDNLDQAREQTIGTDPGNWDTDGDGLSDGDEVIIWKTDPTNPDTDGDTYLDGAEVRNGYSPTGPGKLFQPPNG